MASEDKDMNRVAGGYKAAAHNPRVSREAKQHAQERLAAMGTSADSDTKPLDKSSKASDLGSQQYSEEGYERFDDAQYTDRDNARRTGAVGMDSSGEHNRVMGGYKATLKNPRVSEEAKSHAREVLDQDEAEQDMD